MLFIHLHFFIFLIPKIHSYTISLMSPFILLILLFLFHSHFSYHTLLYIFSFFFLTFSVPSPIFIYPIQYFTLSILPYFLSFLLFLSFLSHSFLLTYILKHLLRHFTHHSTSIFFPCIIISSTSLHNSNIFSSLLINCLSFLLIYFFI